MPRLADHNHCTGCMACYNACSKLAIAVVKDQEGFLQPQIDAEKCVDCGVCERTCPVVSPISNEYDQHPHAYAAWHEQDRRISSSGGAFSAFARRTIEKGGVVYGAAFDANLHLRHAGVSRVADLDALRGSKYVQSEIGDAFRQIRQLLKEGKEVLFCGTPCQVAGLRKYLRHDDDHLLTIDLACHGVPSDKIFQSYLKKLQNRLGFAENGLRIGNYEFRRRDGWSKAPSISTMSNSKFTPPILQPLYGVDALYMEAFNASALFRKSCYHCPFAKLPRVGDITLADFWGLGRHGVAFRHDTAKGVSLIMVNSEHGNKALLELDEQTFREERTLKEALTENHNLRSPSAMHPKRDEIIADFLNDGITLEEIDRRHHLVDKSLKATIKVLASRTGLFDAVKEIYNRIKSL